MATYKEIKGVTVQTRDEDPVVNAGSWSSGGSLNTHRVAFAGSLGSQTAQIAASGSQPPGTYKSECEQYNGTSWTEIADVNTAKYYFDKKRHENFKKNYKLEKRVDAGFMEISFCNQSQNHLRDILQKP